MAGVNGKIIGGVIGALSTTTVVAHERKLRQSRRKYNAYHRLAQAELLVKQNRHLEE